MKKIKFIGFLTIVLGLFFAQSQELLGAFSFQTECQPPLRSFSSGGSTFDVSFPPGGGTTCETISDCPAIKVPDGATIYSIKVDMELTDPNKEVGTPYIWVPKTGNNQLVQIRTSDCSIVKTFSNSADNCNGSAFSSPSRITVIPGGDVWVDNRANAKVTRLGLIDPSISMEDYECKGSYDVAGGGGTNGGGVTFDINGYIWVGNYHDTFIHKYKSDGAYAWPNPYKINAGYTTYGMIGDPYGHVWISSRGNSLGCVKTDIGDNENSGDIENVYTVSAPYGIGMDSAGNIYLACYECGTVLKFDAVTAANCPETMTPSATYDTGTTNGTRGVAVDQKGNIWVANSGDDYLYVFDANDSYSKKSILLSESGIVGVAIDAKGYGWAVGYTNGKVYKYEYNAGSFTEQCTETVGSNPYNYSDMTGLRTVPKTLTIGPSGTSIPLSSAGTFEVCSDPAAPPLCSDSSDCDSLFLPTSCGSPSGECEIPLKIFSMQVGDYTLKNLEVIYAERLPVTTGGLIPCGREWNDPNTSWNDKASCNMCHLVILVYSIINFLMKLVVLISILALVAAGLIYVKTAGDSSLITAAKQNVNKILYGFVIVFVAWAIINLVMILLGFNDPLGDGSWKIFSCEIF